MNRKQWIIIFVIATADTAKANASNNIGASVLLFKIKLSSKMNLLVFFQTRGTKRKHTVNIARQNCFRESYSHGKRLEIGLLCAVLLLFTPPDTP